MIKKSNSFIDKLKSKYMVVGRFDVVFCAIVIILTCIGVVMMYSASYVYAENNESSAQSFFISQSIYAVMGFVAMFILSKININFLFNKWLIILATGVSAGLIAYTIIAGGSDVIKRWFTVNLGFTSFSVQPSEIAKLVLVIGMAFLVCKMKDWIVGNSFWKSIASSALMAMYILFFVGLIFLQSHYSCVILVSILGMSMMWLGGVRKWQFVVVILLVGILATALIIYVDGLEVGNMNYALERIKVWLLKPENIPYAERTQDEKEMVSNERYQTIQGLRAIGSGGLTGVGFTQSTQKYLYIPEPQNDFIFTVVCEELGFIGAVAILCIFMFLIFRGFKIAVKNSNKFTSLIVMGIMLQVGIQVFLNIAVVTDLIPNTGIGLPFFSYGGTALIMILAEMGIVLSVSRTSNIVKR